MERTAMKQITQSKTGKATQISLIAMSAALYAVFFFLSYSVAMPSFTLLYLPIILLGVFPLWFGWKGLVGCMIGAFIGGVFVEGLPLHIAWAEAVTALLIYGLNWLLISRKAAEAKTLRGMLALACVYGLTLFLGTSYILWQLATLSILPYSISEAFLLPTFALNLPIVLITCPAMIRAVSPRLRSWGIYSGSLFEQRSNPLVHD